MFRVQVLVFRVVGVLSEAVRRRSVTLTDGGFTVVVDGCESTGESEQSGCAALVCEVSGLFWQILQL